MSADFPPAAAGFAVGSKIAGYRLDEQIGQGGMAVVFRAHDERLERPVALKILAPVLAADAGFRQRFIRESRAAAAVDDPHIIPVFEAGEANGALFIAMRYVRGGDVRSLILRTGALPPARVAGIVSPVASALDAAHAAGLVHRDVKPANMLLDALQGRPDHVYLSDFGLSKEALGSVGLTGTGQFLGTADYAAPEQVEGRPVDGRTDQYALGCAAFEMLCGRPPFRRDLGMAVLFAHLSEPPPKLSSLRPGLPAAVDAVFTRVLAKSPLDRYGSCREFSDALRAAAGIPPYDVDPQAGHPDTAAAWPAVDSPVAALAADATAAPVLAEARSGLPTVPPGTPDPGPAAAPSRQRRGEQKPAAARWPLAITSAACAVAVVAVAFSVAVLTGHSTGITSTGALPGTSTSPRTAPNVRTSPAASATATSSAGSASPALPVTADSTAPPATLTPDGPDNVWIAQLASVSLGASTAALDTELDKVRLQVPQAQVLDSSEYASLRSGFWVIYYAGSFANGSQALDYCSSHGRTTSNTCIGSFLSHNVADYYDRCYPPVTSPTPACLRQ